VATPEDRCRTAFADVSSRHPWPSNRFAFDCDGNYSQGHWGTALLPDDSTTGMISVSAAMVVRAGGDSLLRHVIAHEIGHAIDFIYGDDTVHARFEAVRGSDGQDWGVGATQSPAEDWAEVYAYWIEPTWWQGRGVGTANSDAGNGALLLAPPTSDQLSALLPLYDNR